MTDRDSTLWEQLSKGIGDAVTDIRQKVVEEPMYGRAVTEQGHEEHASLWAARETIQPNHERETVERDIER